MKTKIFIVLLTFMVSIGCSKEENDGIFVEDAVKASFNEMYPRASKINWQRRGFYKVVTFKNNGYSQTAWYDENGYWYMTEKVIDIQELPDAVVSETGNLCTASIELDRSRIGTIYVIEQPDIQGSIQLYYCSDGTLVKTLCHKEQYYEDFRDEIALQVPRRIFDDLFQKVQSQSVMELDVLFPGIIIATAVDDGLCYIEYNVTGNWVSTTKRITMQDVENDFPRVFEALTNSMPRVNDISVIEHHQTRTVEYIRIITIVDRVETSIDINTDGIIM